MDWRPIGGNGPEDSSRGMYAGEAPARILKAPVRNLLEELREKSGGKELSSRYFLILIENLIDGKIQGETTVHRHLVAPLEEVRKEYRGKWGREPFREELLAVVREALETAT